jgi:molybdopterin-guanine dinucleotide biosynthesis protein A
MVATLGVLLAGGRGSRLAHGVPKALVRVGGLTLLERSLVVLRAVCDEVVVVAPAELALPLDGMERVADPPGCEGPLGGLVAGLQARPCERAIVLAVDFPLMRPGMLRELASRLASHAGVLPAPGGMLQPLAAVYAPWTAGRLAERLVAGEWAVVPAAALLGPRVVHDEELARLDGGLDCFLNLNGPEDRTHAEALLQSRVDA